MKSLELTTLHLLFPAAYYLLEPPRKFANLPAMKPANLLFLSCILRLAATGQAADDYKLGPESIERAPGVRKGRVEQFQFNDSKIFPETTRAGWLYVPSQYDGSKPVALMVFQDGQDYVS